MRVLLKIQSSPKCPTRGRRSATGKSSPCGVVSKAWGKFRSAAYVLICKQEIFSYGQPKGYPTLKLRFPATQQLGYNTVAV